MNELIRVAQLPIIEEHLRSIKDLVEKQTSEAMSLVCNEETIKSVKEKRSELRKQFEELEEHRKAVKHAVFSPYEQFEAVYKECVSDAFKYADDVLKTKIDDTENEIKKRCEDSLRDYFAELCVYFGIRDLEFDRLDIKIDMASAKQKSPKKLMEHIHVFVETYHNTLCSIGKMENAEEIAVEYKRSLSLAQAIETVQERHRHIDMEAKLKEVRQAFADVQEEVIRKVEALVPPTVEETTQESTYTVTFTVTETKERLVALREWMKQNGYQYY